MEEIELLSEAIVVSVEIQCTKCKRTEVNFQTDEFYFADELMEGGWRATKNNIYCPDCAKKYLKVKKA
jgi:Zn finger protein HypA/HybF involved in hydrogenase expression